MFPGILRSKLLIPAIVLLFAGLAGGVIFAVRDRGPRRTGSEVRGDAAGTQFTEVRLVGRVKGEKQWELVTGSISEVVSEGIVRVDGISSWVIFRKGEPYLEVKAGGGVWRRDTGVLELQGGIEIRQEGKILLKTADLLWDPASQELRSSGEALLDVDATRVRADKIVVRTEREEIEATGNVEIHWPGGQRARTGGVVYSTRDEVMDFQGSFEMDFQVEAETGGSRDMAPAPATSSAPWAGPGGAPDANEVAVGGDDVYLWEPLGY